MKLNTSVVNLKNLNLATRIDAEHYQPHFIATADAVKQKEHKKLSDVVIKKIVTGHTPPMKEEKFYGGTVKFIKTDNLRDNKITGGFSHLVSEEGNKKIKNSSLQVDDVIVTIIGATFSIVGRVARVFKDLGSANINQNIALIRAGIPAGYLTCFLLGKYGKQQLYYLSRQTEQVNLNCTEVGEVLIALPSKNFMDKIHEVHDETHSLQLRAEELYSEAQQLFKEAIGLSDYSFNEENVSVRSLKEASDSQRFDAEYWQPKYDEINERVSNTPQKTVSEIATIKKGVEVGSEAYGDEGYPFVRVSDFSIYGIDDVEKHIDEELYKELQDTYKPKQGEVLFTKDGTIGLTYVLDRDLDVILSGAFLRLKTKVDVDSHYLALVLNSIFCKSQIERYSGGAVIAHLKPDAVKGLNVPILPLKKQEEIGQKVVEAFDLRREAKELLEKAKRAVEIFIEEDEKAALSFIEK